MASLAEKQAVSSGHNDINGNNTITIKLKPPQNKVNINNYLSCKMAVEAIISQSKGLRVETGWHDEVEFE